MLNLDLCGNLLHDTGGVGECSGERGLDGGGPVSSMHSAVVGGEVGKLRTTHRLFASRPFRQATGRDL